MKRYIVERLLAVCVGLCVAQTALCAAVPNAEATTSEATPAEATTSEATPAEATPIEASPQSNWTPLAKDDLHDQSATLHMLQNPGEVLSKLPPDPAGNKVNWVKALKEGYINPRDSIDPSTKIMSLDLDILLSKRDTGELPRVLFPHRQHTEWMDCKECHEKLFKSKAGATPITMLDILNGEYCGVCHGAVAFPLTQCERCHSVPHDAIVSGKVISSTEKREAGTPAKSRRIK